MKKEDYQKQLQRIALRRGTRQLKSPSDMLIGTLKTPQRVNTPLTNKIVDGTNLFDSPQRDITPTPMDQSMKDHTTTIQRNRTPLTLTPRRKPNLFETIQNKSFKTK